MGYYFQALKTVTLGILPKLGKYFHSFLTFY